MFATPREGPPGCVALFQIIGKLPPPGAGGSCDAIEWSILAVIAAILRWFFALSRFSCADRSEGAISDLVLDDKRLALSIHPALFGMVRGNLVKTPGAR